MPEAATAAQRPASGVFTLGPGDAAEIARLTAGRRYTVPVLAAELADPETYRWVGIRGADGRLTAVHRALKWSKYLFLKGVFVDDSARGGDGALRLAIALRQAARDETVSGIAAWISESSSAQLALAQRLRLKRTGPPLHLYTLPFARFRDEKRAPEQLSRHEAATRIEQILERHHVMRDGRILVPDLLGGSGNGRRALPDRDRLILGSLPCADAGEVHALLAELAPAAGALGLSEAELPAPVIDIPLALWLVGRKARRVSARAVYVGRSDFSHSREETS